MNREMFEPDRNVDFKFGGPLPNNDLISYTNMMMEMNHTATTDGGCLSFLVFGLFVLICIVGIPILFSLL